MFKEGTAVNETNAVPRSSAEYSKILEKVLQRTSQVTGYLTDKECALLVLFACYPTVSGAVLEIGAYKGLSTALIAVAMEHAPQDAFHTCDPWAAPGVEGQDLRTDDATFLEFQDNLRKAGVQDRVIVHRAFAHNLAPGWNSPLRFLWIDGDHSVAGTEQDYHDFASHVAPGGVIAFHDVLHHHPGPSFVFATRVLLSEQWGACGFSGSIGWAQRVRHRREAIAWRQHKLRWFRHLIAISRGSVLDGHLSGWARLRYKWSRTRIPHAFPDFDAITRALRV